MLFLCFMWYFLETQKISELLFILLVIIKGFDRIISIFSTFLKVLAYKQGTQFKIFYSFILSQIPCKNNLMEHLILVRAIPKE